MPWAKRTSRPVPAIGANTETYSFDDYSKGMNSFLSNDSFPNSNKANYWRLAQNARIVTLGEYENRKGFDFHSDSAGLTQDQAETSTTGAADQTFSETRRIAQKFTTASGGRLSRVDIRIKNANSATGTVMVEVWTNSSGVPGDMIARSSIASSSITSSYAYLTARFANTPMLTTTTVYWIVVYTQPSASNTYNFSSTTNSTNALISTNSGVSWSTQTFSVNFKQYYSTDGGTKGLHRAYKSDGTAVTLFAHGTVLYSVNEVTGALTSIKTGLSASATDYRFTTINDVVYYVNGYDGLRKWDFTTESQVSATNYTLIEQHKGLLFLATKDDPNKVIFSNFADYETFTSTDFIYVPSPKTGDPVTAIRSLNGYLLLFTSDNKYILSGDDNATFRLDEAPDQKGTFRQETTAVDKNYVYYFANDGVYKSNGSEAQQISNSIYSEVLAIQNRESVVMCINRGRLYMWHRSIGSDVNDQCFVWNLNYGDGVVESFDTKAPVARALTAYNDDNQLLVANSYIGAAYWQELASNDHTNLGDDIDFLLTTHYNPFGNPSVLKEIRYWNPRFEAQSANYTILSEYAYDLRDNWTTYGSDNVQGAGYTYAGGAEYGGGAMYGRTAEIQSEFYVPGEYRRIAIRYKHFATRQPQTFLGHTFVLQKRRIR